MSIARGPPLTSSRIVPWATTLAEVDDGREIAGLLDLVEQVRGEQHGPALADEVADQVAELEDAGRVEPVHRLVEDQQLGIRQQAARDAEALAHAERVGADLVVGAGAEADALERGVDAAVRRAVAGGGVDVEVLAAGEVAVEARLLDDRADAGERRRRGRWRRRGRARASSRRSARRARAAGGSAWSCRRRWRRGSRRRCRAAPRGRCRRGPPRSPKRLPSPRVSIARSVGVGEVMGRSYGRPAACRRAPG